MKRRKFWRVAAAASAGWVLARREWALAEEAPPLRVVFYTDVHAMPGLADEKLLERAARQIEAERPDVLIAGGDVIHRGYVSSEEQCRARFALYRSFVRKLPGPVRHVAGNHDLAAVKPEPGRAPAQDPWGVWRQELGEADSCYEFERGGVRFLVLDTLVADSAVAGLYRGEAGEQRLAWLRERVEAVPAGQPFLLCVHIPLASLFLAARHRGEPPENLQVRDAAAVWQCLAGRPPLAVLQGHLHVWEQTPVGGIPVLTAGAVCGAWWKGSHQGTPPGYARVEIAGRRLSWAYVAIT